MKPWSYCNLLGETLTFIKLISHWNSHFYRLFANKQRIRSPLLLFSVKHYPYKRLHFLGTPYKSMDYIPENATCLGLKHASLPRIRITSSNFIHSPLHMGIPNLHPFQLIISSCLHSIEPLTWFVVYRTKRFATAPCKMLAVALLHRHVLETDFLTPSFCSSQSPAGQTPPEAVNLPRRNQRPLMATLESHPAIPLHRHTEFHGTDNTRCWRC